jgi:hypothetical protein
MPSVNWSPRTVPYGADETVYVVVDSCRSGSVCRETEVERTDLETIIDDLLAGQFNNPVRIVAFNTLEHWSEEISAAVASEISVRCDIDGLPVPEHLSDFVDRYAGSTRRLAKVSWARVPRREHRYSTYRYSILCQERDTARPVIPAIS